MKILLLVAGGWISFMNQGRSLQRALKASGAHTELLFAGSSPADITHTPDLRPYRDHLIITIGSWQDYDRLIKPALEVGCKVLPWIVSDAAVDKAAVDKLNQLPWFLTTSEYCRDIFIRDGINPPKVRVLYETVDEDIWAPANSEQIDRFLDYLSIDEDNGVVMPISFNLRKAKAEKVPILLTIGGDATSKGAMETIAALHKLDAQTQWVWIIKTLPYPYSWQSSVDQYEALRELLPRVKFITGEFSEAFLVQLMCLCDIYIAPSRGEGFGLPLVEAQMCGKMVITHDATSTQEIVIKNQTGLLANHHTVSTSDVKGSMRADPDSLAIQLQAALTNNHLRDKLSAKARPIAIERFGKQAIAKKLLEYIQEFIVPTQTNKQDQNNT